MNYKQIQSIRNPIRRKACVEQAYLDYFNNFLTVARFAEHYECSEDEARALIEEGRHWNHLPKVEAIEA